MSEFHKLLMLTSAIPILFVSVTFFSFWGKISFDERVKRVNSAFMDTVGLSLVLLVLGGIVYRISPIVWGLLMILDWILMHYHALIVKRLNLIVFFIRDWINYDYTYAKKQKEQNK